MEEPLAGNTLKKEVPVGPLEISYAPNPINWFATLLVLVMTIVFLRGIFSRTRKYAFLFLALLSAFFFIGLFDFFIGITSSAEEVMSFSGATHSDFMAGVYVAANDLSSYLLVSTFAAPMALLLLYRRQCSVVTTNNKTKQEQN